MSDGNGESGDLVDPRLQRAIYLITELAHSLTKMPKEDTGIMISMVQQCVIDATDLHHRMHEETEAMIKKHGSFEDVPAAFKEKMQECCNSEAQEWVTGAAALACAAAWNPAINSIELDQEMLKQMGQMTRAMYEFNEQEKERKK